MMNLLFLSCKKSSELIEKKSAIGLSTLEQVRLHLHTSMCTACTAYQAQSKDLDVTLKKVNNTSSDTWIQQIPSSSTNKLKDKIKNELNALKGGQD